MKALSTMIKILFISTGITIGALLITILMKKYYISVELIKLGLLLEFILGCVIIVRSHISLNNTKYPERSN